jgi:excisionase family DNA binding protein
MINHDLTLLLQRIEEQMNANNLASKEIFSVNEAAEFLGLKTSYLYQLTSKRLIPFYRPGRKLYFKKSDLVDWISKHRQATVTEVINKSY